jgi:predicted DNA-binding transcriptional regulator AlpA
MLRNDIPLMRTPGRATEIRPEQRFHEPKLRPKQFRAQSFLIPLHSICTLKEHYQPTMEEILTPTQVAERLQVKPSWVYEQTRERAEVRNPDPLPHMKMGRYLRFDWKDVIDWLERRKSDFKPRTPSQREGN